MTWEEIKRGMELEDQMERDYDLAEQYAHEVIAERDAIIKQQNYSSKNSRNLLKHRHH